MLDKNNQRRIEHFCFLRRGQRPAQHERRHICESDLPDQLFVKIVSPDENTMGLGLATTGHDFGSFRHLQSSSAYLDARILG